MQWTVCIQIHKTIEFSTRCSLRFTILTLLQLLIVEPPFLLGTGSSYGGKALNFLTIFREQKYPNGRDHWDEGELVTLILSAKQHFWSVYDQI